MSLAVELANQTEVTKYQGDNPPFGIPMLKPGMFCGRVVQFPLPNQIGFVGSAFAVGESEQQVRIKLALEITNQMRL